MRNNKKCNPGAFNSASHDIVLIDVIYLYIYLIYIFSFANLWCINLQRDESPVVSRIRRFGVLLPVWMNFAPFTKTLRETVGVFSSQQSEFNFRPPRFVKPVENECDISFLGFQSKFPPSTPPPHSKA